MPSRTDIELTALLQQLEAIAADLRQLESLSEADLARQRAAGSRIAHPNRTIRRQMRKEELRAHRDARLQKTEASRHETGIRSLRRKLVFTTPNYFLPDGAAAHVDQAGEGEGPVL